MKIMKKWWEILNVNNNTSKGIFTRNVNSLVFKSVKCVNFLLWLKVFFIQVRNSMAVKIKSFVTIGVLQVIIFAEVGALTYGDIRRYLFPLASTTVVRSQNVTVLSGNDTKEALRATATPAKDPKSEYTVFYPTNSGHKRGGKKNLNFTVVSGSADDVQSRIVNHPELYYSNGHEDSYKYLATSPSLKPHIEYTDSLNSDGCVCVPYYLCKDGIINSGGRQIESPRSTGSVQGNKTERLQPLLTRESKYTSTQTDRCEPDQVCCKQSFSDHNNNDDDNYYPVATPQPDYAHTPRYPDKYPDPDQCGIRRSYGVQSRLQNLLYSADVAEFGEYPWQVAVLKRVEGDRSLYLCGGVLIAHQWVATAAHCIKQAHPYHLQMRFGEWDVNRQDEVYPYLEEDVEAVVIHPGFEPATLLNDIALIRSQNPVYPLPPHVTPVCLPPPWMSFEKHRCWVSGWGKDFFGPQGEYQNVLKEVDVPVVSHRNCEAELQTTKLGPHFRLHPGFLCAGGEPGKDACTGDGGSPLVCENDGSWYVVGLVSWGIGCGQPRVPGVYVNMIYYSEWITDMLWR